ncbi:hypothetical protein D3C84_1159020 [compost metagenome]
MENFVFSAGLALAAPGLAAELDAGVSSVFAEQATKALAINTVAIVVGIHFFIYTPLFISTK